MVFTKMNVFEESRVGLEAVQREWWLYLLLGVAMIVLGLGAISVPFIAALAVLRVIGYLFIVGAIVQAIAVFRMGGTAKRIVLGVVMALLYLFAGLVLLAHPVAGILWFTILLGIYFFVEGIIKIVASIEMRAMPHRGWVLFGGILSLILGLLIVARLPSSAIWVIGLLLGIDLFYGGATIVALSLAAHGVFTRTARLAGEH
jgi:uncharacterized membrane protein HdeD (DUF308 family)